MKVRIVPVEVTAFLITYEPDGVEIEFPDDLRQQWEDAWGIWSDVNAELRRRYESKLSRSRLSFEVDGPNVSRTDQQFMEP